MYIYIYICTNVHGRNACQCVSTSQLSIRQFAGDAWDASFRELRQEGSSSYVRFSSVEMKVCGVETSRWVLGELLHRCFKSPSRQVQNLQQAPNALTEGYTVPPSGSDRCALMPSPTSRTGGVSSDFWRASLQRLGRARPRHGRRLLPKAPGMILSSVLRHRPWFPRVCVSDGRGGSWQPRAASFSESEGICSLQSLDMKRWPAQR